MTTTALQTDMQNDKIMKRRQLNMYPKVQIHCDIYIYIYILN